MFIKDINQQLIEVTDLQKAIDQAKMFANMHHCDKRFRKLDKRLQLYWKDVLEKLIALSRHH